MSLLLHPQSFAWQQMTDHVPFAKALTEQLREIGVNLVGVYARSKGVPKGERDMSRERKSILLIKFYFHVCAVETDFCLFVCQILVQQRPVLT